MALNYVTVPPPKVYNMVCTKKCQIQLSNAKIRRSTYLRDKKMALDNPFWHYIIVFWCRP